MTWASRKNARAMARRCHCPIDSSAPPSHSFPSGVAYLKGNASMRASAPAWAAAETTLGWIATCEAVSSPEAMGQRRRCSRKASLDSERSPGRSRSPADAIRRIEIGDVDPINRNPTFGRPIESKQEPDECSLACPVLTNQRHVLIWPDRQIYVGERRPLASRKGKAEAIELDALTERSRRTFGTRTERAPFGVQREEVAQMGYCRPFAEQAGRGPAQRVGYTLESAQTVEQGDELAYADLAG